MLDRYLTRLGYGTRREVARLFVDGRIMDIDGRRCDPDDEVDHDRVRVNGAPLDPPPGAVILLHKPVGYVCSARDVSPLVYELLPPRFRSRKPIVAPVGRLDLDTSGLLLLTDDGQFNHRITSPRTHLAKTYDVALANDLRGDEPEMCASGTLMLSGDDAPLQPAVLSVIDSRIVRLTVTEGRYHQVRRMFAAMGNHVVTLHRSAIGTLELGTLGLGEWRLLTAAERELLIPKAASSRSAL